MTNIVFLDDTPELFNFAVNCIKDSYQLNCYDGSNMFTIGRGYELNMFLSNNIRRIDAKNSIICLGEAMKYSLDSTTDCAVIANSLCAEQMNSLNHISSVIACGCSQSDTVSYTGLSDDSIIVSLNRGITALSGRNINPLEIPLSYNPVHGIYPVLAVTALRLLLDDFNSDIGKLY